MPPLAHGTRVIVAFAALYVLWGSTYLAIKYAIDGIPPLLMAGTRFLLAGIVMFVVQQWRGAERPTRSDWLAALIIGSLTLGGGNYAVVWSETRAASGVVALIVAAVPIWMVVLDAFRPGGRRPGALTMAGIAIGLGGVSLLVDLGPVFGGKSSGGAHIDPFALGVLMLGTLSWALGSIYSKHTSKKGDALQAAAMQMIAGGALLTSLAFLTGQANEFSWSRVDARAAWSWMYLVIFGSIIGYTAYIWLLKEVSAAKVSTYSYVNPLVAVLLGWALGGEPLTLRIMVAAAVILGSVGLITARGAEPSPGKAGEGAARRSKAA